MYSLLLSVFAATKVASAKVAVVELGAAVLNYGGSAFNYFMH